MTYATKFESWGNMMRFSGSEDLRVQKTISAIHEAFETMILETNYDKITVKALCERARINKKTFYRYYETLDFLLAEIMDKFATDFLERIKNYRVPEDLEKINREFFIYSTEQGDLYERIVCYAPHQAISRKMISHIINQTWNSALKFQELNIYEQNLLLSFIYNVGLELYRQWVSDDKKLSLEEIITLSNKLLCTGVFGFIN